MKKITIVPNKPETIAGYIYLAVQLLILPSVLALLALLLPIGMDETTVNIAYFVINFLCVLILFRRYLARSGKEALHKIFRCLCYAFAAFAAYWLSSILISAFIYSMDPAFSNVNDDNINQMTQQSFIPMAIGTVLLAPVTEEVLYRGVIFGKLYNRNPALAYLVSTLVFAAIHIIGYVGMYEPKLLLLCLLQYLPAGVCLGWAYASTGTIYTSILVHIAVNSIAMISMR